MGIPSTIESLSATIGSNDPTEGDGTPMTSVNDGLRAAYGFLRQSVSAGSDIASASTITPPSNGSSFTITGTTTVTAIGSTNSWNGRVVVFRHGGAHAFTHSSSLVCLGGASTTFASGDFSVWRQQSSGVWEMVDSSVASNMSSGTVPVARLNVGTSAQFIRADGTATGTLAGQLTISQATGNPVLVNTNTGSDAYFLYTNSANTAASGFRVRNTSGADAQFSAYANTSVLMGSVSNHPVELQVGGSPVITLSANKNVTINAPSSGPSLSFGEATTTIVPGATSYRLRDAANSATNWQVTNAGIIYNPSGTQPSFAGVTSAARTTAGTYASYTESFDQNSNFNPATGVFTCPVTGLYFVSATIEFSCTGTSPFFLAQIRQNSSGLANISTTLSVSGTTHTYTVSALVRAASTDTLSVYLDTISGGTSPTSTVSRFNGVLLF